jgi:uncharacterized YigZ family protein
MSFNFKTVSEENRIQFKEKGSNFITYLFPIKTEEEFKIRLYELKSEFPDASHHCYGFRLDKKGNSDRSSDDGEPSGTAGKPILNQLLSNDLNYCAIVIIRYFGGVKLGTGGLIKAYKEASKAVIESADIILEIEKTKGKISFDFEFSSEINKLIKLYSIEIIRKEANDKLNLFVSIPLEKMELLKSQIEKLRNVDFILLPQ